MRPTVRTITVLFTDLVGSTETLTALGPAAGDQLRSRYFAAVRGALAVHGGDEVKTLGDGFMAVFASASDAIGCAVTLQRGLAAHTRRHPDQPLRLRIGISAGEASFEDGDYFGLPVVEASRLCAAAGGGEVLTSDVVRALTGGAGIHRLAEAGALTLKGLPAPVHAWRVDWDPDEGTGLRVALADDSVLLREGLARVLESEDVDVVLQASDADELLRGLAAARPNVVVVDVRMPPTHTTEGLLAAERIRSQHPHIGVLVLSASVQASAARRLLGTATGGIGYMLKERIGDIAELTAAIRTIATGGSAIDPEVVALLADEAAA
jgi:class 3 adenylate cyclase/CheY-like chemotaxis protein